MRQPDDLAHEQLATLVRDIRDILYLDLDDESKEYLNPDKIWDADTLDSIAGRLRDYNLVPRK